MTAGHTGRRTGSGLGKDGEDERLQMRADPRDGGGGTDKVRSDDGEGKI